MIRNTRLISSSCTRYMATIVPGGQDLGEKLSHFFMTSKHTEMVNTIDESGLENTTPFKELKLFALEQIEHKAKIKAQLEIKRNEFNEKVLKPLLEQENITTPDSKKT